MVVRSAHFQEDFRYSEVISRTTRWSSRQGVETFGNSSTDLCATSQCRSTYFSAQALHVVALRHNFSFVNVLGFRIGSCDLNDQTTLGINIRLFSDSRCVHLR